MLTAAWAGEVAALPPATPATTTTSTPLLTPYPPLQGIKVVTDYLLTDDGHPLPIYQVTAGRFAILRAGGRVQLSLQTKGAAPITAAVLRPLLRYTQPTVNPGTISFEISGPGVAALEINGDTERPIFLLVNPPETLPEPSSVTHYFGPGKLYTLPDGKISLKDGESVYIAGGAVVHGSIIAQGSRDKPLHGIRIAGQGLIDPGEAGQPLALMHVQNARIEGLTLLNTRAWTLRLFESAHLQLSGLRILAQGRYSDAIDILGSTDVEVRDSFLHSGDDCVAIKGAKYGFSGNVERVTLENLIVWKGELGNGIGIGYETETDAIRDITVRNVAIIHCDRKEKPYNRAALAIHNGGKAVVSRVLYEDITIEQARENLINLQVALSTRAEGSGKTGAIHDITFRRVRYIDGPAVPSVIDSKQAPGSITDIRFEDCEILGRKLTRPEVLDLKLIDAPAPSLR